MSTLAHLFRRARVGRESLKLFIRFARHTGLVRALRPSGLARFIRSVRGARPGPHWVFRFYAENTPNREALACDDTRRTYAELDQRIAALARGLAGAGIRPRDAVGLMIGNRSEFIEAQMAIAAIGATAVSIGYRSKAPEVAYVLSDAGCKALLFDVDYSDNALAGAQQAATPLLISVRGDAKGARPYEDVIDTGLRLSLPEAAKGVAGGVMVYTSGTTGKPKGAFRDLARTGLDVAAQHALCFPLSHDDRHLACCPLYHSAAPAYVALTFAVGGTVVLLPHFEPELCLATMARERITSMTVVPTMLNRILALPDAVRRRYDISSLRWVMAVAAPLPTELAARVEAAWGPILYNMYGATEMGFVTVARPGEHTSRPGTVGRVIPGNEVRLYDPKAREVTKSGEVGEVFVRNSMLMSGYHRNEEATRCAMRDGFVSVGDLARFDSDGYLYIVDRKVDMVISGGVNIYPLEIEQCLSDHPDVHECAVVGVPDPDWGERLEAFVVLREGAHANAKALEDHCRQHLADFKRPRRFAFLDILPRTETGKVLKRQLRAV